MTTKILGVALVGLVAGCNAHDPWEPVSAKITGADCEYRREIPDTAEGADTYLYRIHVEGEIQGPTDADAEASITLLDWTPQMTCPDWGENCRRDSLETGISPFESRIDLAMAEERQAFEFYVLVNGWDSELEDAWSESAGVSVVCERGEDGE